jgi:3-phosphoshikimate 1-carboxyvinyltransferase
MVGVNVIEENDCLSVNETKEFNPFVYDATDCPDLFPALVLLACRANGVSCISGVHRLWHKESNRATALVELFSKMGVQIKTEGDDMIIHGKANLTSVRVQSYQDHRMAMVTAAAGLIADGPVEISGAEAIDKSYPDFFADLRKLGANINKQTN